MPLPSVQIVVPLLLSLALEPQQMARLGQLRWGR